MAKSKKQGKRPVTVLVKPGTLSLRRMELCAPPLDHFAEGIVVELRAITPGARAKRYTLDEIVDAGDAVFLRCSLR